MPCRACELLSEPSENFADKLTSAQPLKIELNAQQLNRNQMEWRQKRWMNAKEKFSSWLFRTSS